MTMRACLYAFALLSCAAIAQTPGNTPIERIGPDVSAPKLLKKEEPTYTGSAKSNHIEGTAILQMIVSQEGRATNIEILSPLGYGLDESAIEAISKWKFSPGMKQGIAVPILATVEVNFRLQGEWFDAKFEKQRTRFNLALQKLHGRMSDPKNTAVSSMQELAAQNFPAALYMVGMWQINGDKLPQDADAGRLKIQKAADKNYGPALYQIALPQINDPQLSSKAWDAMRKASTLGSSEAQYFLGDRYEKGDGVAKSVDQAKNHFRLCASKGHPPCEYRMAALLYNAPNRRDWEYEQALAWYRLASNDGVRSATEIVEKEKLNLSPAQAKRVETLTRQLSSKAQ
jgi:TonB family protein